MHDDSNWISIAPLSIFRRWNERRLFSKAFDFEIEQIHQHELFSSCSSSWTKVNWDSERSGVNIDALQTFNCNKYPFVLTKRERKRKKISWKNKREVTRKEKKKFFQCYCFRFNRCLYIYANDLHVAYMMSRRDVPLIISCQSSGLTNGSWEWRISPMVTM